MTKPIRRRLVAVALMVALGAPLQAGEATKDTVVRGDKVRVTTLDEGKVEGYLVAIEGEEIRVHQKGGAERTLAVSQIVQLEVARQSSRLRGAALERRWAARSSRWPAGSLSAPTGW